MPDAITTKVDDSIFKRKLNKLISKLNEPLKKDLPLYTEWFIQSVIKATPPKGKVKKKRTVIELKTNRYSKRGKELKRYKVPYRTNKKKGAKYFGKKKDANAFAKIKYRFIGKYAWLAAGHKAIGNVRAKLPKINTEILAIKHKIARGFKQFNVKKPFISVINMVENISRYATFATISALRTTQRRIEGSSNKTKVKKRYGKLWR